MSAIDYQRELIKGKHALCIVEKDEVIYCKVVSRHVCIEQKIYVYEEMYFPC